MTRSSIRLAATIILALQVVPASSQSVQYLQHFDGVTPPDLPPGWSSPENAWQTSTSVASTGSGVNNAENTGNAPGTLVSPVFDLSSSTNVTLSYLARRTSTYDSLNLQVEGSIDGGSSWPFVILDSTAALPGAVSSYEERSAALPAGVVGEPSVRFRFRSRGVTGGNLRLDDVTITADGVVSWNRFGFASPLSQAVENTDSLVVPIALRLIPSSANLQGLQFSVQLSSGLSFVSIDAGLPNLTAPGWHISFEPDGSSVHVVAISEGTAGLPSVEADSLFLITVATQPLGGFPNRTDTLTIDGTVASAATILGEDLFLAVDPSQHVLTVVPEEPNLSIDPDTIAIGTIVADSTVETSLTLTNSGTGVLEVFDMYSISGLLTIVPAFATIAPDSSSEVTLTVDASLYGLGILEDWVVIDHDGPTAPDTVLVSGLIVSSDSRGDANADGFVDVVDLVTGVDLILGRISLPETEASIDLHPFPEGNGTIDVRDLTILAQAITRGIWPDDTPLPAPAAPLAKAASVVGDLIISRTDERAHLWIRTVESLRAVHLVARLHGSDAAVLPHDQFPLVHFAQPYRDLGAGSFSILVFGVQDDPVPSGEPVLLATIEGLAWDSMEIVSLIAVDAQNQRRSLVAVRESSEPPPQHAVQGLQQPYPNPVNSHRHRIVHLPLSVRKAQSIELLVTDILGRTVKKWSYEALPGSRVAVWDLQTSAGDFASPGLYFVTAQMDDARYVRSVTVR